MSWNVPLEFARIRARRGTLTLSSCTVCLMLLQSAQTEMHKLSKTEKCCITWDGYSGVNVTFNM